jgi:hypothetical protein
MERINSEPSDIAKVKHPHPRSTSASTSGLLPKPIETHDETTHQRRSSFPSYDFDTKSVHQLRFRSNSNKIQLVVAILYPQNNVSTSHYDEASRRRIMFQLRLGTYRLSLLSNPTVSDEGSTRGRATGVRLRFTFGRSLIKIAISLGKFGALIIVDGLLSLGSIIVVIIVNPARILAFRGLVFLACVQLVTSFWKPVRQLLELEL